MKTLGYILIVIILSTTINCKTQKEAKKELPRDTIFFADIPIEKIVVDSTHFVDTVSVVSQETHSDTTIIPEQSKAIRDSSSLIRTSSKKQKTQEGRIFFKIQLAASRKTLPKEYFKNIQDITIENHEGWIKYVAGFESDQGKIISLRNSIRAKGLKDAWVVCYLDKKRIKIEEIAQSDEFADAVFQLVEDKNMAKKEQSKPLTVAFADNKTAVKNSKVPESGIYFKVQIAASKKILPKDYFNNIQDVSVENHEGWIKYLVGIEQSQEKIMTLQNNIKTKGIKDAWIVVYKDGKRVISKKEREKILQGESSYTSVIQKTAIPSEIKKETSIEPSKIAPDKTIPVKSDVTNSNNGSVKETTLTKPIIINTEDSKPVVSEDPVAEQSTEIVAKKEDNKPLAEEPVIVKSTIDVPKPEPTKATVPDKPATEQSTKIVAKKEDNKSLTEEPVAVKSNKSSSEPDATKETVQSTETKDTQEKSPEATSENSIANKPSPSKTESKPPELKAVKAEPVYTNVDKALKSADKVENLDLSNQSLIDLPDEIAELSNLRNLNLFGNNLKQLPEGIEKMENLKVVGLGKNTELDIKDALQKLSKLPNLESLYLSFNNMKEMPAEIGQLKNLKKLMVFHNQIASLPPEIGQLINLQQIGFSYCQFTHLPPELENLQNLEEVYLLTNEELEIEDALEKLGKLSKLKKLHLYDNRLIYIPPIIGKLTALEELDLGSNQLSFLPKEVENLVNLKKVNISGNQLSEIPSGVELIPNLEELKLSFNLLNDFPAKGGRFKHLKKIDLSINKFVSCPVGISSIQSLEWINLRGNKIPETEIQNLKKLLPKAKILH